MSPNVSTSLSLRDLQIYWDPRVTYVQSSGPYTSYPVEPHEKPAERPKQ